MKISDLQPKQGKVELTVDVIEKEEPRTFEKFGKAGKVANALVKDDSGNVKLTLWNEQVDQVNVGDKLKITNGWVNEYQGELQLTSGKFGKLEVIGTAADAKPLDPKGDHILTDDEKTEEELLYEDDDAPSVEESMTGDELDASQQTLTGDGVSIPEDDDGEQILTEDERLEEEILDEGGMDQETEVEDSETDDDIELEEPVTRKQKKTISKSEAKELADEEIEISEEDLDIEEEKIE